MKLLLDTHLLIWTAYGSRRLSAIARTLIEDEDNELLFSAASVWEIAIKSSLGRPDCQVDPHDLRQGLLANEFRELPVLGAHALFTANLPPIHKDPFDRLLVAQAIVEGITLLTVDPLVAQYRGPVRGV